MKFYSIRQLDTALAYETSQRLDALVLGDEPTSFAKSSVPAPVFSPDFVRRSAEANGSKSALGAASQFAGGAPSNDLK